VVYFDAPAHLRPGRVPTDPRAAKRWSGYVTQDPHGLRPTVRRQGSADDGAAHLPNKRLQLTVAVMADFRVPLCSAALLRNVRLCTSTTAPAAEARIRYAAGRLSVFGVRVREHPLMV